MAKERYGFISVFNAQTKLLGYVPHCYKSKIPYIAKWLSGSQNFSDWSVFVLWIDGKKEAVIRR